MRLLKTKIETAEEGEIDVRKERVGLRRERAERVKKKKTSQELLLLTAFTGLRFNRRLAGSLIGE